mgnify:CR=1 FL=1
MAAGIALYFTSLTIGGWLQGEAMLDASRPFMDSVAVTLPYLKARSVGGGLMVLGHLVFAAHFIALVLGMLVGTRFGHPAHWTRARYALLAVAASFGYMIMAYTELSLVVTATLGVIGAFGAHFVARWRRVRAGLQVAEVHRPQPAD